MVFLDDLKDLVLYKKPFVLPINEKTIKKGSAIFLISPSFSASVKAIKSPYLVNKMDVFQSYYLEKNANYYINKEGFLQDIESTDEYLYEVGENDAMLTPAKKVEDYQGDLFFISDKYMDGAILNPRIPDNYFTQNGYEDITTPRVCFCSKVNNCLTALGQNVSGKEFYVYSPSTREGLEVWQPNEHSVPDFKATNEYWVLKPVQLKLVGRIRCTGSVGDGKRFTYGGDFAQTYDWNYKWLEKHGETISDVKPVEESVGPLEEKLFQDFKDYIKGKKMFEDVHPLSSPMMHEAKKKKETWLLLATYSGKLNKQNTSQFLPQLQKNVKYNGAEVEFHTCYLPGDIFIFIKIPERVSESASLQEAYAISGNDTVLNFDKWKKGSNNILYVTGLSGSGKTTLGEKYEKEYNAHLFEIDGLEFTYDSTNTGILEKIEEKCPEYASYHASRKTKEGYTGNNLVGILKKALSTALDIMKKDSNNLYIVEGVQIFQWLDPSIFSGKPVIIKGTSALRSAYQRYTRGKSTSDNSRDNILKLVSWYIKSEKSLSKFKKGIKESEELQETARSELPESEFGVPGKRKFPLDTPERVKSAIRFFNYVDPSDEAELAKRIKEKAKKFGVAIRCGKKNRLSKYITKEYVNEFMAAGAIGNDAYAVINGSIKQAAYQNGYKYIEDDEYPYTKKRKESRTIHKNTMMNNDFINKE